MINLLLIALFFLFPSLTFAQPGINQYADGDPRGGAIGILGMVDDGTNIQAMSGDTSGRPNVNVNTVSGAIDTELPAAVLLADNTSNPTVPGVGSFGMVFDGSAWDRIRGDSTDGLLVNLGTNNDVTANAGTNLNTSLLALESGGNLATLAAKDFATQTTLAALNAKFVSGTDIGDVTINNAPGASAVNIQDGGNSITIDAPVGTPAFVRLSDGAAAITTLPVSLASVPSHDVTNAGTFAVQAAQSGTWTVQPGNTANTTAWLMKLSQSTTDNDVDVASIAAGDNNIGNVDIVTFPDNEPINIAQWGGTAVTGGSGTVTAGSPRVVLATDVALPAGTNAIGKLSANSGIDIGDVDVTSVTPGTAATNLGKAEDVAHSSGDTGVFILVVRNDTPSALAGASGRYIPLTTDSLSRLWVANEPSRSTITNLFNAQVFNNVTTSANSSNFSLSRWRYAVIYFSITKVNTPTDLRLIAQFSNDGGTTYFDWAIDQWTDLRYAAAQMPVTEAIPLNEVVGTDFRLRAVATGTTATNTITLSAWIEGIS